MRFLFISKGGESLGMAARVGREGHSVAFYCDCAWDWEEPPGTGITPIARTTERLCQAPETPLDTRFSSRAREELLSYDPDVVVFDMVGFGPLADRFRREGIPVIGGSQVADWLELDRGFGTGVMRSVGIRIPDTQEFQTWEEAKEFARSYDGRLVLKPSGNAECAKTYVSRGKEDLLPMMELYSKSTEPPVELQEFVEGVEVSCEGWFDGEDWLPLWNSTWEEKRLFPGGVGPNTGCMGSVVKVFWEPPRLFLEGVGRMEELLRAARYTGPLDLNSIVTESGVYGLEWTSRFGYVAVENLCEGLVSPLSDLLHSVVTGGGGSCDLLREHYLAGIRLTVPPWPHKGPGRKGPLPAAGIPVMVSDQQLRERIWWGDVRKEDTGNYICTGLDGVVCVVTASGQTLDVALREMYSRVGGLVIPDLQYRSDIGQRVYKDEPQLAQWGWLPEEGM